jgi:hypothetical protein
MQLFSFNSKMHKLQTSMQKHAQALAHHNGLELNYDTSNMQVVDELLLKIAAEISDHGLTTEEQMVNHSGVKGIAESIGCYIAECAERKLGKGTWFEKDPNTGDPTFSLLLRNDSLIYPIEWVYKKLLNPKDYSIQNVFAKYVT